MNYKALALGAVVGFLAALSPACGETGTDCNASNCNTCCSADGTCVTATTDQACGATGNACVACPTGQTCTAGACKPVEVIPDGGETDPLKKCQENCKTGCCTASGQCSLGTSASACGTGGEVCKSCGMGQKCDVPEGQTARQCFVPPVPDAGPQLGTVCEADGDCSFLGAGAKCITQTSAAQGSLEYAAGYCTVDCSPVGECPDNSACIELNDTSLPDGGIRSITGQDVPVCLAICDPDTNEGCSDFAFCVPFSATQGACVPFTGIPEGTLGKACAGQMDCAFPPPNGFCYPAMGSNGPTGFAGGACMADCTFGNNCGDEGICIGVSETDNTAWCIERCTAPNNRGECRTGYACAALQYTDGGMVPDEGICFPDCNAPGWGCDATKGYTCDSVTGSCVKQ